ncbi:MAG: hypothetical protein R3C11_00710 [Planctomycetaceae bacterium]
MKTSPVCDSSRAQRGIAPPTYTTPNGDFLSPFPQVLPLMLITSWLSSLLRANKRQAREQQAFRNRVTDRSGWYRFEALEDRTLLAAPVADAGGPYVVEAGETIQLDASNSTDADQDPTTLTYQWDLDNDGLFGELGPDALYGDEIGISPTFSAASIPSFETITIGLRVTDSANEVGTTSTTVSTFDAVPEFDLVKVFGGPDYLSVSQVKVDSSGNLYLMGEFDTSIDLDPGPGTMNVTNDGSDDTFLIKLNAAGEFIWGGTYSSSVNVLTEDMQIDASGNIYLLGTFEGTVDLDPGAEVLNFTSNGGDDLFFTKLNSSGELVWARTIGGTGYEWQGGIDVDSTGNVYISGSFEDTVDLNPGAGVSTFTTDGFSVFIEKLNSAGEFIWAKQLEANPASSSTDSDSFDLTLDDAGNVYLTGTFEGKVDFDPGTGVFDLDAGTQNEIYVSKLNNSGEFLWARMFDSNGFGPNIGTNLEVDSLGNVYTTGRLYGTIDFDPGAGIFELTSNGGRDVFLSKLDASGNFVWATSFGGNSNDVVEDLTLNDAGEVFVTGSYFGQVDFDSGPTVNELTAPNTDPGMYFAKFTTTGELAWVTGVTGRGYGVETDSQGNVYASGYFLGTVDFDPGAQTAELTSIDEGDAFVWKLDDEADCTDISVTNTTPVMSAKERTQVTYTVTVRNLGNKDASNVHVEDIFPQTLSNVTYSVELFDGATSGSTSGSGNLSEDYSMPAGSSAVITINATVAGEPDEIITHTAVATVNGGSDDVPANNAATNSGITITPSYKPIADPGGPYLLKPGETIQLDASGTTDVEQDPATLNFRWDLDGDGIYGETGAFALRGDELGITPTFTAESVYTGSYTVKLRVFDSDGNVANATTHVIPVVDEIDPSWALAIGGTESDDAKEVAVDSQGNIYTLGSFKGTVDFDPGPQVMELSSSEDISLYLTKHDPAGNLLWVKQPNTQPVTFNTRSYMEIDSQGNVYIAGAFKGIQDFDPGAGEYFMDAGNFTSIYLQKLDSAGNFVWAQSFGDPEASSSVTDIAVGPNGDVYISGSFYGTVDFDGSANVNNLGAAKSYNLFAARYSSSGNLIWAEAIPSYSSNQVIQIAVDGTGSLYVGGRFQGIVDFDPGPEIYEVSSSSNSYNSFVLKLNSQGNFSWVRTYETETSNRASALGVDPQGNVYMTGWYNRGHIDTDPGNPGGELESGIVSYGTYLTKHSSTGELIWAKSINSYIDPQFLDVEPFPYFESMSFDSQGNLYLTGDFAYYADLDPGPGYFILKDEDTGDIGNTGRFNMLVASYNSDGEIRWAETIPGSSTTSSSGNGLVVGSNGTLYITGQFTQSVDFNPRASIYELTSSGSYDGFLWKFVPGNAPVANTGAPAFIFTGQSVQLDGSVTWDANQDSETLTYYWDLDNDGIFGETGPDAHYGDEIGMRPVFSAETILTDTFTRIHLMVLDNEGNFDTIFSDLHIREPHPPTAVLGGPFLVRPGEPSGLNAELSSDVEEERDFLLFEWDLDNDGIFGETGPSALYGNERGDQTFFTAPANSLGNVYPITLRVTDNDGFVDVATSTITVIETETAFGFATSTDADYLAVDTDAAGNVYVTGSFTGTVDFDPGPGVVALTSTGNYSMFVTKTDSSGSLIWARMIGSDNFAKGEDIVVDASGNAYITGNFRGLADFNPGTGIFNLETSFERAFYLKLNTAGNFEWALMSEFSRTYEAWISFDANGNLHTTGLILESGSSLLPYISKIDTNGNFISKRFLPYSLITQSIYVLDFAIDENENLYLTGYFSDNVDFDSTSSAGSLTAQGNSDIFVAKYNATGGFVWVKHFEGDHSGAGSAIDLDDSGNIYVTGSFRYTVDFDPGPDEYLATVSFDDYPEGSDGFLLKLTNDGDFDWVKTFGAFRSDAGYDIAITTDSIYLTGYYVDIVDFDLGENVFNRSSYMLETITQSGNIFLSRYDLSGNFIWTESSTGSGNIYYPIKLAVDGNQNVFVAGNFFGTKNFYPRAESYYLNSESSNDSKAFLWKIVQSYPPEVTVNQSVITGIAGEIFTNSGTFSDMNSEDTVYLSVNFGSIVQQSNGTWSWSYTPPVNEFGTKEIVITAVDNHGATAFKSFELDIQPFLNYFEDFNDETADLIDYYGANRWAIVNANSGSKALLFNGTNNFGLGVAYLNLGQPLPTTYEMAATVFRRAVPIDGSMGFWFLIIRVRPISNTPVSLVGRTSG